MSTVRAGGDLERAVKKDLEINGYFAMKSGGSRGKADVMAAKPAELLLVQCKKDGVMGPGDRHDLYVLASWLGAVPLMASWRKDGRKARTIAYTRLHGAVPPTPWTPDHAMEDTL